MSKMKKKLTLEEVVKKFEEYPKYMTYGAGKQSKRWRCSRNDIKEARRIVRAKKKTNRLPKILVFDIETSPMISYHWGHWQQNIYLDQVIQNQIVLTWSAKWLYADDVLSDKVTSKEAINNDDKRVVGSLWKLLNEADITIAHYGDKYDTPWMNSRFVIHGFPPPNVVTTIDTKKVASKTFRFASNKLDALAGYFGMEGKIKTDFDLWKGCMNGDQKSIDDMNTYCDQDVRVLEEVYLKLRPFIKAHPNVGLYLESDEPVCAACGSENMKVESNDYYTPTGRYSVYRCNCGALSRQRTHNMDAERRKILMTSVAK